MVTLERTILHIDMNSCYASIELLHRPELRSRSVAVGGDETQRHGIILAKNDLAKKQGVKTGEALWQAREKCPGLPILKPDYPLYLRFSRLARELYDEYTDRVEPFGLDECWADLTGCCRPMEGETVAHEIRKRIKTELGVTVSIGVSFNKIFAKLGSDYKKPDAVTVFTRENFRQLVWPLPAGEMLYVGPATQSKLYGRGIKTIGDLAQLEPRVLQGWFGKMGPVLHAFANGEDLAPVAQSDACGAPIKSIGNSATAPRDLVGPQDASIIFFMLADSVCARLRQAGLLAKGVQISLRDTSLNGFERQLKFNQPSGLTGELHDAAMDLIGRNHRWTTPLRSVGLRAIDLIPAKSPQQLSMFEDAEKRERLMSLERTVDSIRGRFGHSALLRAAVVMDSTLGLLDAQTEHTIHPVGYFHG